MIFRFPQTRMNPHLNLNINGVTIEQVKEFKFLGTLIDETLSWNAHVTYICRKVSRNLGILKRSRKYLPQPVLLQLYNSLIMSHLTYSLSIWGFNNSRLFKIQKKAIRIISNSKYNAHTDPLFKNFNFLKLQDLFYLSLLKLYYKYRHDNLPGYFSNIFKPKQTTHQYSTRNRNPIFHIPKKNSSKKSLRFHIPKLLQKTPPCIVDKISTHSYDGFCNYAKNHLISQYKNVCVVQNCYICGTTNV